MNDQRPDLGTAQTVQLDIRRMLDTGVLVDIDLHGFSMFTSRATWEELGIRSEDTRRGRIKRGEKDLIPQTYLGKLRSLETRFRQSLDKHSFNVEGFKPWRWVPYTAYNEWLDEKARLDEELDELKADILNAYDGLVDLLSADFAAIAREAWAAIRARRPSDAGEFAVVIPGHGAFESLDQFTDYIVQAALRQFPSRDKIASELYADYHNALLVSSTDLEAEKAKADAARAEAEAAWAATHQVQTEMWEQEQLAQLRVADEKRRQAAMRQAEIDHARQQLQQMVNPFQDVVDQLRAQIYSDVVEIARSIDRNGHIRGKVAERARGLLDTFRLLNANGDRELENALEHLRTTLTPLPVSGNGNGNGRYDTAAVSTALGSIADITHQAVLDIAARSRMETRASALELD